jgi:enamine deaminase RidA (YjgF/YER057c/UK114 family)
VEKVHINPEGVAKPFGYSHVVTVSRADRLIFLAGQVALDAQGNVAGKGDVRAQVEQCLRNLVAGLEAAGATVANIVKMNTYIVGYKADMLPAIREARAQFFTSGDPPASTLVGVQALAGPDFLVEIECVAAV